MGFVIIIFGVTVLFLLAGAIPWTGADNSFIFRSPFFISLLGLISILSLYCCWKRMRSPAFLLPHLGALIILAGALLTFIFGKNTQFNMPVTPDTFIDNVPAPDGSRWELGFRFSVTDFRVEYYTADNGSAQLLENAVPKDYEATIRIVPKNGNEFTCLLKVNRPVSYEGWRIYLISYGNDAEPYVQLLAKKDIGRGTVITGIWMLIIGTFINCFKKKVHLTE